MYSTGSIKVFTSFFYQLKFTETKNMVSKKYVELKHFSVNFVCFIQGLIIALGCKIISINIILLGT